MIKIDIEFKQWYYVWIEGEKLESWYSCEELREYIHSAVSPRMIYFEPVPKIISILKNK